MSKIKVRKYYFVLDGDGPMIMSDGITVCMANTVDYAANKPVVDKLIKMMCDMLNSNSRQHPEDHVFKLEEV